MNDGFCKIFPSLIQECGTTLKPAQMHALRRDTACVSDLNSGPRRWSDGSSVLSS